MKIADKNAAALTTRLASALLISVVAAMSGCASDPMAVYDTSRAKARTWDPSSRGTAQRQSDAINKAVYREIDAMDPASPVQAAKGFIGLTKP